MNHPLILSADRWQELAICKPFVTFLSNIFACHICSNTGIISTFLHVHPFGASIEYICSYLQRLDTKVTGLNESRLPLLLWPSLSR